MKKILFGITSLTLGGAERVLVDLANKISNQYDVTIFTLYANGELEKQLNKNIKHKSLYSISYNELSTFQRKLGSPLKVLLNKNIIYKNIIKEDYDIEIAFLEGPITRLFSVKNNKTRKIVWIHNDIANVFGKGIKAKLKKWIDKKIYLKYETLIFVSQDNLEKFNEFYNNKKIQKKKKEVIYNYIDKKRVLEKANEMVKMPWKDNEIHLVTIARLVPQKAIDRLVKICGILKEEGIQHQIYVIGDGPEREKLELLIKEQNVEDIFHLLGKKENPYPYIKNCDYFCLLSLFEGYGMVLEESKILNKPIIITNTAAREAVKEYENAIVLENTQEGILKGLREILKNEKIKLEEKNTVYDNSKMIQKFIDLVGE